MTLPNQLIIANGDPARYSETGGPWIDYATNKTGSLIEAFYGAAARMVYGAVANSTAKWSINKLLPGMYQPFVDWVFFSTQPVGCHYQVYDGTKLVVDVLVSQAVSPRHDVVLPQPNGLPCNFQSLCAPFQLTSDTLTVILLTNGQNLAVANALLIQSDQVFPGTPPPQLVANAGPVPQAAVGSAASFSGQASGGVSPYSYQWDFGDGTPVVTGTLTPSHSYATAGTYTVTLTVTDSQPVSVTAQLTVVVAPRPLLTVNAGTSKEVRIGATIQFAGQVSGGVAPYTTQWDFGDGSPVVANNLAPSYTYQAVGSFKATLTATDSATPPATVKSVVQMVIDPLPAPTDWKGIRTNLATANTNVKSTKLLLAAGSGDDQTSVTAHMDALSYRNLMRAVANIALTPTPAIAQITPDYAVQLPLGKSIFKNSAWNMAANSFPKHASSDQWMAAIGLTASLHMDFGVGSGIPITLVPGTQRRGPIKITGYPEESDTPSNNPALAGGYFMPSPLTIEDGSDAHGIVVDTDNWQGIEGGGWNIGGDGSWQCTQATYWDYNSNGMTRPAGWTSADAGGSSILAGLARYEEAASAQGILHALRFTAPSVSKSYLTPPCNHWVGTAYDPTKPMMGVRIVLRADYPMTGLDPIVVALLTCFQIYGLILCDAGLPLLVQGVPHKSWPAITTLDQTKQVKGSDFYVVDTGATLLDPGNV